MEGEHQNTLSIEYGFPSGTRLMGILHIHLMIYSPECRIKQKLNSKGVPSVFDHELHQFISERKLFGKLSQCQSHGFLELSQGKALVF